MLERLNQAILGGMDLLAGWLLALPRDVAIILVAFGSAVFLVGIRKFATDQALLRRCASDRRRLREFRREVRKGRLHAAFAAGSFLSFSERVWATKEGAGATSLHPAGPGAEEPRAVLARLRATGGRVALKAFAQEWKPLLISILPIALLATWCWQRLEYLPPGAGEPVTFTASLPLSAVGQLAHLVPTPGLQAPQGWIRPIGLDTNTASARATWTLVGGRGLHLVTLRYDGQNFEHPLLLGEGEYSAPSRLYQPPGIQTEVSLQPARLFGFVPGVPALGFPPWLVAYLLLAVVAVPAAKRVLRVY